MRKNRSASIPLETLRPKTSPRPFPPRPDYSSLCLKDLLEARDAYHVHLAMQDNVFATAVGRYLIHHDDWYAQHPPSEPRPRGQPRVEEPRTLDNSVVRPWSWPAVLVFVREWQPLEQLGSRAVPRTLYLPDGRSIPVCVIHAAPDTAPPPPVRGPFHNSPMLGGGYQCLRRHQGQSSVGTLACLVRKGGSYYALTSRHVAGDAGEVVTAYHRGEYNRIGETVNQAVGRVLMSEIFPEWAGTHTYLTLDAGLVRIDDIAEWTSQVFGIGEIADLFDATAASVNLDLIGCPVRAFGGTTGVIEGEIRGLFYRTETSGGFDYATDVLIGERGLWSGDKDVPPPFTRPGDSGTLWFYDPPSRETLPHDTVDDVYDAPLGPELGARARRLRPIAMQWGAQRLVRADGSQSALALGSFLSSVCRALDVEVIRDWSTGHDEYWGKIAHFAIGWKACELLKGPLAKWLLANQVRIGFDDETLARGSAFKVGRNAFVPLSDVPDYIFTKGRPYESMQHFADVDIRPVGGGETLLKQCVRDSQKVSASVWESFFDGFARAHVGPEAGALPFRVWQIFDAMVDYLKAGDLLHFIAAAGVLAHYVGDATQPLHCSYLHHGLPPMKEVGGRKFPYPARSPEYRAFKKSPEALIHEIFDEQILEVKTEDVLAGVDSALARGSAAATIRTGHDAAVATIHLMDDARKRLPPSTIIKLDDPTASDRERAERLWNIPRVRSATIAGLADSVRLLADLWTAAWSIGGGSNAPATAFEESDLDDVCRNDPTFLPSMSLEEYIATGKFEAP